MKTKTQKKKVFPFRIPMPPPGGPMKVGKKYNRERDRKAVIRDWRSND